MNKKATMINVVSSLIVLFTNILINFILSPYIIKNIGVEANGFITLANNTITYINLIVIALNSMAARFITIEYTKKNYEKANLYYNSVFWGNLIIVVILLIPVILFVVYLENFFDIPQKIIFDVKILFLFVCINFFVSTGLPNWDCGTYVVNKLNLSYYAQAMSYIIRSVILICMFSLFYPRIWFVGLAATVMTLCQLIANCYFTHKYTPELKIDFKQRLCSWDAIKVLVSSGIWSSFSSVGGLLLSGLDLLICNIFLGAKAMGILSLSKVLYNLVGQLAISLRNSFQAELTISYAQNDREKLRQQLQTSMKIISVIMSIPVTGIVVLGDKFYQLWVPSENSSLLYVLTILSLLSYMVTCSIQALYNVFTLVNKVKANAIAMFISGVISTCVTLLLISNCSYGLYAVAGVSSVVNLIRNFTFATIYTSKSLDYKWYEFYPTIISSIVVNVFIICIGLIVKRYIVIDGWFSFGFVVCIIVCIGLIVNLFIYLNKQDRNHLISKIKKH